MQIIKEYIPTTCLLTFHLRRSQVTYHSVYVLR